MDIPGLKATAIAEVERRRDELIALSVRIHDHPELGFEERKASAWLSEYLEQNRFTVERGFCELETAFRARCGGGEPRIAFLAEYDALPGIGHGCGHNIIAAAAVGAACAMRGVVDEVGGTVLAIGTPAEEGYGGKVLMMKRGAFTDLDAALIVHPGSLDIASIEALACIGLEVEFHGRAAHAAAQPHQGINALEAMVLAFNGINSLRQHVAERARIHGIITHGGEAANIVPDYSAGHFLVRAEDEAYLEELQEKVLNCFRAAALATGARLEHRWQEEAHYAPLKANRVLAEAFAANMAALGRTMMPPLGRGFGSSDVGNVSMVVPSIHPLIAIAPLEVATHSEGFTQAAVSEEGHHGLLDGAKAMAMTAIDLLARPELMARVREEFLAP